MQNVKLRSAATLAALAITGSGVGAAGVAFAAGSLTFKIHGEYAKRTMRACGRSGTYRFFDASQSIEFKGVLASAPGAAFTVTLHLMRCTRGRYVGIGTYPIAGKSSGKYKTTVPARLFAARRGVAYYSAYTTYVGQTSDRRRFAVGR